MSQTAETRTAHPRPNQRQRTREAILDGARQLMAQGEPVTVAAAAGLVGVSRATAYRYFSDPQALAVEAGLDLRVAPYEAVVAGTADLRARLAAIAGFMMQLTLENEESFRQLIAHAAAGPANSPAPRRGARRVAYFQRALEDFASPLPEAQARRLVAQLSAATGIEALIAFVDIARTPRAQVPALAAEMVAAILDRHLGPAAG
ncbi:TetR/AcrR family transcriptional regulator [Pararhodobacter sp. SW119]|uniref:TetR/AcrR family transcriptional regulator n=1 Tax=Pararhodobacter sp. SW119 TaxID=2780075 RepID=UPI001ADFC9D8|nr:TetR/AcrR family transcriptional regulator [Pararhodobacter sp. SW119]